MSLLLLTSLPDGCLLLGKPIACRLWVLIDT